MKILVDKARFEELEAENVRLKEEAAATQEDFDALKLEWDSLSAENEARKNRAISLADEREKLKARIKDLLEERNALLARYRELEATQTDFEEATREQLDQARDHFKKQAEKMLIEIGDLKKELKALSARNAELLAERDKLLAEVGSLEKRLSGRGLSFELDLANAHREKLAQELDDKKVELARIVAISNQFARERDSYREQYELYQHEYMLRGEVIKKLRKRLHKLKKKLKH